LVSSYPQEKVIGLVQRRYEDGDRSHGVEGRQNGGLDVFDLLVPDDGIFHDSCRVRYVDCSESDLACVFRRRSGLYGRPCPAVCCRLNVRALVVLVVKKTCSRLHLFVCRLFSDID
jgi:hypothetical protein